MNWVKIEKGVLFQTYKRQPLVLAKGKGAWVWDANGKKYLDFFSGLAVNNIGHCHPSVIKAVTSQIKKLIHTSNLYYTIPQIECAEKLIKRTFQGKVFFCNSGAEANECALKLARRWGHRAKGKEQRAKGRFEMISFNNSFHGRTMGTISLTGQKKYQIGFDPFLPKVVFAEFNHLNSVKKLISKNTCAVFVEPIQGEGGIQVATKEFLFGLREICSKNKILLVFDEVQCGLGRTGKLFCYEHAGIQPDVLTVAKGLGGGLPIGAAVAKNPVAALFERGDHASTFGGNPVICSAALEVLKILDERLLDDVTEKGMFLTTQLQELQAKYPGAIQDVRGMGLMVGCELKVPGNALVDYCRKKKNILFNCTHEKVIRFLPPLTVSFHEIKCALAGFEEALQDLLSEM